MCDGGGSHSCDSGILIAETSNSLSDSSKSGGGFKPTREPTREQRVISAVVIAVVGGLFVLVSILGHFFL